MEFSKKWILAVLAGFSLSISLPNFFIPFAYLIGFTILFNFITKHSLKQSLLFSFLLGFTFSILSFYWIIYAISYYGELNLIVSSMLFILFSITYSAGSFLPFGFILKLSYDRYGNNSLLLAPFFMVFLEFYREFFPFNGFPWNLTGYMISYINPIAQFASLFSVYGLSFLVVFSSVSLFLLLKRRTYPYIGLFMFNLILFIAIFLFGKWKIENYQDKADTVKVVVIQGNVDESLKLKPTQEINRKIIDKYTNLMKQSLKENPDLIVLPESAIPIYPYIDTSLKEYFFTQAQGIDVPKVIGFDNIILTPEREIDKVYNSVFLLDRDNRYLDYYNKIKLVPFGEYTPFKIKLIEETFTYLQGIDFMKGDSQKILVYNKLRIVPLVCFESIFPDFVSNFVSKGGNLIVNITNDGWFGKTSGPYQHFEMARLRAIENGVYLIRAANTGISAFIDPVGNVRSHLPLLKEGYITYEVSITNKPTFFNNYKTYIYFTFILIFLSLVSVFEIKYRVGKKRGIYFGNR